MSAVQTLQSLSALLALTKVELSDAALDLAGELDQQAIAQRAVVRCERHAADLDAAFIRLFSPGSPVYVSAMGMLTKQAMASRAMLTQARAQAKLADERVDEDRLALQRAQARYDRLSDVLDDAAKAFAIEQDKKHALELDDLFVARRQVHAGEFL